MGSDAHLNVGGAGVGRILPVSFLPEVISIPPSILQ